MSEAWHTQREQSAGRVRLTILWYLYRFLGKGALKLACIPVMAFIYPFARPAKKALCDFHAVLAEFAPSALPKSIFHFPFSTFHLYRHLQGFAWSLADKMDACTCQKNLPKMSVQDDASWRAFQARIAARQGAFLISTHVGTIEVLPALAAHLSSSSPQPLNPLTLQPFNPLTFSPHVHAFQQLGHDAVFTQLFLKHFNKDAFTLHAVEDIGVETAVDMQAAIAQGDLVLMAGDRVSAGSNKTLAHPFLGRACSWPKGVFTFARLMACPIFFITCVRTGWNAYAVRVREFIAPADGTKNACLAALLDQYVAFLTEEVQAHPEQWYQFYDFFGAEADEGK